MPVAAKVLAVRGWPQDLSLAVQDLRSDQAVTVIGVATPMTTDRTLARALVRDAVARTLEAALDLPTGSVKLVSQPGEAIAVEALPGGHGLSLSHAPGLSIAAIGRGACVGVDLMRVEDGIEGDPDWMRLAYDYLGPQVTAVLQTTAVDQRPAAFANAWTRLEACLKCLGLALTEWSPALEAQLTTCRVTTFDLADVYGGSLAIVRSRGPGRDAA